MLLNTFLWSENSEYLWPTLELWELLLASKRSDIILASDSS